MGEVSTDIVRQSAVTLPVVPTISSRFTSGALHSESDTSPIPSAEGIRTRISSTAASRTVPRLKLTT
jgi:hypothetical protein